MGFGIDKHNINMFFRVWPCSDLEMTLRWPWGDTSSKAQHQPMATFTPNTVSIFCHGGSSCGSTLLHFSNFFDSLQLWERGVIGEYQGGNHPQGWNCILVNPLRCVVKWNPTNNVSAAVICNTNLHHKLVCNRYKNPKNHVFCQFDLAVTFWWP